MKAKLAAIAALLSTLVGGGFVVYVNWDDVSVVDRPVVLDVVDYDRCDLSPCNALACQQGQNLLNDAGHPTCSFKFADCDIRVNQATRDIGADSGTVFGAGKYHRLRTIGELCYGKLAIPLNDAGWPVYATSIQLNPCAWKPNAGADCSVILPDGGLKDPGVENTITAGKWQGSGCVRRHCVERAGDP